VEAGSTLCLQVLADGFRPLSHQWFFNWTNALSGRTNSSLDLPDIQPSQAGAYTVVVTNVLGAVTSNPALVGVIPPVPRRIVSAIYLTGDLGSVLHLA